MTIRTVAVNREGFNKCKYSGTHDACQDLIIPGFPSECDFGNMVHTNLIHNFPINSTDIANAKQIFGPDVPSIKGKSTKRRPTGMQKLCGNTCKSSGPHATFRGGIGYHVNEQYFFLVSAICAIPILFIFKFRFLIAFMLASHIDD